MTLHDGGTEVAQALERQGVRFLLTLCGGHISPILVACERRGIRVIDVRHEATAVFAADAISRLTGVPGVAAVTAGPGLTNTITAVKNAQLAQSPLLVLGGATATLLKGRGALQDIDQTALMRPHVKGAYTLRRTRDLGPTVTKALRLARAGVPGPVFVECPVDLLYPEEVVRDWYGKDLDKLPEGLGGKLQRWYIERHLDRVFAPGSDGEGEAADGEDVPAPSESNVRRAAELLRRAERPVLVIGSQALSGGSAQHGAKELAAAVESLGLPVFLAGMARGLLGRDHPLHLRRGRKAALRRADVVVLAGLPCDFRLNYGRDINRRAELISINLSLRDLLKNRRPDLGVVASPGLFLKELARRGAGITASAGWLDELRANDRARGVECLAECEQVDPIELFRELDSRLPDESVLVVDGGDFVATASYIVQPRRPLSWLDPGVFGTLGVGAGFALGARLCRPEAEVWLLYGDGALGYSLIEMDTFARHGLPVIALVGNDASWAQIARDQVGLLGHDTATKLAPTAYHEAARGLGAEGLLIERGDQVAPTLERARQLAREGRPVLVNALISTTDAREGSISI